MARSPTTRRPTELARALVLLSDWRARVAAAEGRCGCLAAAARAAVTPYLQELTDRCDHAANAVLRLERMESARDEARLAVELSIVELEGAWLTVERVLRSSECAAAGGPATRAIDGSR